MPLVWFQTGGRVGGEDMEKIREWQGWASTQLQAHGYDRRQSSFDISWLDARQEPWHRQGYQGAHFLTDRLIHSSTAGMGKLLSYSSLDEGGARVAHFLLQIVLHSSTAGMGKLVLQWSGWGGARVGAWPSTPFGLLWQHDAFTCSCRDGWRCSWEHQDCLGWGEKRIRHIGHRSDKSVYQHTRNDVQGDSPSLFTIVLHRKGLSSTTLVL